MEKILVVIKGQSSVQYDLATLLKLLDHLDHGDGHLLPIIPDHGACDWVHPCLHLFCVNFLIYNFQFQFLIFKLPVIGFIPAFVFLGSIFLIYNFQFSNFQVACDWVHPCLRLSWLRREEFISLLVAAQLKARLHPATIGHVMWEKERDLGVWV